MAGTKQVALPDKIGAYEIVSKLADGAMGTVYKARSIADGQMVAIKLASAALSRDPVMVKRFEQEFRIASSLNHPNIIRGLEFGWQKERPFIVMELVDGEDMWERIQTQGRFSEGEAVGIIVQVARGLHEAHKRGIIHRDVKPDNILLTKDGQAKLADLGLSKDLEENLNLTRPDKGLGTPNFIAPEQFGDAKNADVRCDIYSLGATLYMALTGEMPFNAPGLSAILQMKMTDTIRAPRKLVPSLSEHVDFAVRRAMQVEPERRFASCPELIAALTGDTNLTKNGSAIRRRRKTANKSGKERRAAVRYDCALPTRCTINLSVHPEVTDYRAQWDAQVCDLSVAGIGLILSRRFEPGSVLEVVLTSEDGATTLTREMRAVRVEKSEGRRWFISGPLSEKLTKEQLRQLL